MGGGFEGELLMSIRIEDADLEDGEHGAAVVALIDGYARGPGGQNAPLTQHARSAMVEGLRSNPMARVYLAWVGDTAAGVAVCVRSFSTFAGRPSINIHDLAVDAGFQGRGVGSALIDRVAADARASGACKVTLEVHDGNDGAKRLYEKKGFGPWQPATWFVSKPL